MDLHLWSQDEQRPGGWLWARRWLSHHHSPDVPRGGATLYKRVSRDNHGRSGGVQEPGPGLAHLCCDQTAFGKPASGRASEVSLSDHAATVVARAFGPNCGSGGRWWMTFLWSRRTSGSCTRRLFAGRDRFWRDTPWRRERWVEDSFLQPVIKSGKDHF